MVLRLRSSIFISMLIMGAGCSSAQEAGVGSCERVIAETVELYRAKLLPEIEQVKDGKDYKRLINENLPIINRLQDDLMDCKSESEEQKAESVLTIEELKAHWTAGESLKFEDRMELEWHVEFTRRTLLENIASLEELR